MQFLLNVTREELANTLSRSASVSTWAPGGRPLPADVTALLDAQLRVDQALDWAAPLATAMGPR